MARATGMSRTTIHVGIDELGQSQLSASSLSGYSRIRRPGGGRKCLSETDTDLLEDLQFLVDPVTRGDPESSLKCVRKLM